MPKRLKKTIKEKVLERKKRAKEAIKAPNIIKKRRTRLA
jgi:hypothetical protein